MSFLFKNTNTHVALDIIIQNKYIKDDNELLDLFNKMGNDRSLQGIKQMIYELSRCGLITRNNYNDIRPTEIALTIPKILDKKNYLNQSTIEQCLKLINYLEDNELFIKNTILAFSINLKNNGEILDYLIRLNVGFKSDDQSHIPAMKNFLAYLGILDKNGDFTNLGSNILNYLSGEINYRSPKVWLEKTYLKNKDKGEYDIGKALYSPQKSNDGKHVYKSMTMTNIGDVVLHLAQDNNTIIGISKISSEVEEYSSNIPGLERTEGDNQRPWYLLRLSDYIELKKSIPIYGENGVLSKNNKNELDLILKENKNLFYDKNHNLVQGSYFSQIPNKLLRLINDIYNKENGENLPYIDLIENSYWQIAPGENARFWPEMEKEGYIAVGWGNTPDLSDVKSKDELFQILRNHNYGDTLQNTQTNKLWQFLKEIKIGDKLVINKGKSKIVGIGEVIGDYYFKSDAIEYRHRKKVKYIWSGEVDIPSQGKFGTTLVEISKDEFEKITSFISSGSRVESSFNSLLECKKQIILYGPPGTGKTFKTKQYATEFLSRHKENILPDNSLGQNVWIIKIDPKGRFFDVIGAINDEELTEDVWPSNSYKDIKKGDIGLMCTLGQNAGIYAQINILSNPEMMLEPEASLKHWKSPDHKNTKIMRVKYNYKYKFTDNPILISDLLKIKGLENLEILTRPQDTNFKVKKEEWEIISKLIEERII